MQIALAKRGARSNWAVSAGRPKNDRPVAHICISESECAAYIYMDLAERAMWQAALLLGEAVSLALQITRLIGFPFHFCIRRHRITCVSLCELPLRENVLILSNAHAGEWVCEFDAHWLLSARATLLLFSTHSSTLIRAIDARSRGYAWLLIFSVQCNQEKKSQIFFIKFEWAHY